MQIITKSIDHLGLVAGMIEELQIKDVIDNTLAPSQKKLSHSNAISAMILNGLGYANKQLYLTPRFFEKKAVDILIDKDIKAEDINDDSLGRTLDAIYEYGVSELYTEISSHAMKVLKLIPGIIHLDSTSFHVDGKYNADTPPNEESKIIHITKGYSRDHHPELNQIVLNLIVENRSGIPILMKAANGNQIDSNAFAKIIKEHIKSFKDASSSKIMLIADAALYTKESIKVMKLQEIDFISRVPMSIKEAKTFLSKNETNTFSEIDENYSYIKQDIKYCELNQQWILYKSTYATSKEDKTLQKNIFKTTTKEYKSVIKLQKEPFFCEDDAIKAYEALKKRLKYSTLNEYSILAKLKYKTKGRPKKDELPTHTQYYLKISISLPIDTMKKESDKSSGVFILATNDMSIDAKTLLAQYKSQQRVERGFRFLKSPEFLSDAFYLKKPQRIEAMLMIMTLCLMVYAALEYRIRLELKEQNKSYVNQVGKSVQNPTTKWIFECFNEIHLVIIESLNQKVIANLLDRNSFILDLLGHSYWAYYRWENFKC